MMSQLCKKDCREQGSILALMLFIMVVMLTLVGLAVDAGNLYRARLWLQKAADAGALAGIGATILQNDSIKGLSEDEVKKFVIARARQVTHANLKTVGIKVDPKEDITPSYEKVAVDASGAAVFRLTVNVRADIKYLLIHLVPFQILGLSGTPTSSGVDATATQAAAERAVANISLVLDISKSMSCPSSGPCKCLSLDRKGTCESEAAGLGVTTKLELLKSAVQTFIDQFDQGVDRISMVPFNIAASLDNDYTNNGKAVRFEPADGEPTKALHGFSREKFDKALANFTATSSTNVCDGFMRAYREASRVKLTGQDTLGSNQQVTYVYFSDGAPTAARLLFADPDDLPKTNSQEGAYDYLSYAVQWAEHKPPATWFGPSPLSDTNMVYIDHPWVDPPAAAVPDCSSEDGRSPSDSENFDKLFSGCLKSMAAHLPNDSANIFGKEYGSNKAFATSWREQYYNCAIELSDYLRDQHGTVLVIGLGQGSTVSKDPYQDIDDVNSRKDTFLARVANDYNLAYRVPKYYDQPIAPEFFYQGYNNYEELQNNPSPREGLYIATDDPKELEEAFKKMATRILLRLVR